MYEESDYKTLWVKAEYATMGWGREPEPVWDLELDGTGVALRVKGFTNP